MQETKKLRLYALTACALALAVLSAYPVVFVKWIVPLYAVCVAVFVAAAFLLFLALFTSKGKEKPILFSLIGTAVYTAALMGITPLVNNVIFGANAPWNSVLVNAAMHLVFWFVMLRLIRKNTGEAFVWKPLLCVLLVLAGSAVCVALVAPNMTDPLFMLTHKEERYFEAWSEDQAFARDYCAELEKDPGKDFVILNLADIQLTTDEAMGEMGAQVKRYTDRLVEEVQPDLITLTGDNAWSGYAYLALIRMLESYEIPWAPVMGNHDGQGAASEFWCAYKLSKAKHCLFRFGPEGMGYGNYIINITENGEIIHTLFLMDTHSYIEDENSVNGPVGEDNYDHLWPNQFTWYTWALDGIEAAAGRSIESTVIFHIPLYEYKTAWETATGVTDWESDRDAPFIGEYALSSFGVRHEYGGWSPQSNGFFDLIKEKGSTKNVLCGHDHVCDYSVLYEGVRLTYALKDGPGCYWEPELNGGTVITVGSSGSAAAEQHFIPAE